MTFYRDGAPASGLKLASPGETVAGATLTDGVSSRAARADHGHGAAGVTYAAPVAATGQALAEGVATTVARSDHVHTGGTQLCTSTTRPASPFTGMRIYETDTKRALEWNGTLWIPCTNLPAVRAYSTTAQAIQNSTVTAIALDLERFDTDGMHSTTTNNSRLTCVVPGVYVITGGLQYAANTTGLRLVAIRHSTAGEIGSVLGPPASSGDFVGNATAIWKMAAGEYVELIAFQTSGGTLNTAAFNARSMELAMVWHSPG